MKKRLVSMFLVFSLVVAFFAPGTAWAHSAYFGKDVVPLSEEELSTVEGEFSTHLLVAAGGAVAGGIGYLITTPVNDWNLSDGLKHSVSGALGGLIGHWCSH